MSARHSRLSPDGRRVLFAASDNSVRRLWVRAAGLHIGAAGSSTEGAMVPSGRPTADHSVSWRISTERIDLGGAQPQVRRRFPPRSHKAHGAKAE